MKKFWAVWLSLSIILLSIGPDFVQCAADISAARPSRLKVLPLRGVPLFKTAADLRLGRCAILNNVAAPARQPARAADPSAQATSRSPFVLGAVEALTQQLQNLDEIPAADLKFDILDPAYLNAPARYRRRTAGEQEMFSGAAAVKALVKASRHSLGLAYDFSRAKLPELRQVAGDGAILVPEGQSGHSTEFVYFEDSDRRVVAPGVGFEGFFWKKRKLELKYGDDILLKKWKKDADEAGHWKVFFPYLLNLLAPFDWAAGLRAELEEIRDKPIPLIDRNRLLNRILASSVMSMREQIKLKNKSLRDRFLVYTSFARAYNRLREGKNYFESLDKAELERIRDLKATALYTIDIFRIGERKRWGSGGGSPFAIESYHVKEDLGGDKAKQEAARRMRQAGLDHGVDVIPNHAGLGGEEMRRRPENFIHILPERQPRSGEDLKQYEKEILDKVPHEKPGLYSPMYDLIPSKAYPGHEGRDYWMLVHHPVIDAHWIDMGQHDFSRSSTREDLAAEGRRLVREGARVIRMDMASSVIGAKYWNDWIGQLSAERDGTPDPHIREQLQKFLEGFTRRRVKMGSKEFLKEFIADIRQENPEVVVILEGYHHFRELSATGANYIYNKVGLYDATWNAYDPFRKGQNNDAGGIMAAEDDVAYRDWQLGGAKLMNFGGTFDGGEGNAVDKFTDRVLAVYALALMHKAGFVYNGQELGTTQAEMLISDALDQAQDRDKAIPFSIRVLINWLKTNPRIAQGLKTILEKTDHEALTRGEMSTLEPVDQGPIAAFTYGFTDSQGAQKAVLVAGNIAPGRKAQRFVFNTPVLSDFGTGFMPRADRNYILKDYADLMPDGRPKTYQKSGRKLLEDFWIILDGGNIHIFDIEEVDPNAPVRAPPHISGGSDAPISPAGEIKPARAAWNRWTTWLNVMSLGAYFGLQFPQIYRNFTNLNAGHPEMLQNLPWLGYSFGTLASLLILPYFLSKNEKPQSFVQTLGILANMAVLFQLSRTIYMPPYSVWAIVPAAAAGLIFSYLNYFGKIPQRWWSFFQKALGVFGLSMLIPGLLDTFKFLHPAISSAAAYLGVAALLPWGGFLAADYFGRISGKMRKSWERVSAWLATLLFMFGPVAGLVWAWRNPSGIPGTDLATGLLAMAGALLMLPRAIYTRDRIWFVGTFWAVAIGGWFGFFSRWWLFSRFHPDVWNGYYLTGLTMMVAAYLGFILRQNGKGQSSIFEPLKFLAPSYVRNRFFPGGIAGEPPKNG